MPLRTLIFKDDIVFYKFINMFIKLCWECVFNDPVIQAARKHTSCLYRHNLSAG